MASNWDVQFLSFNEDQFDLEKHKKTAYAHTQDLIRVRRIRRWLSLYRVVMWLLAFVVAFFIYSMATHFIMQLDYERYHKVEGAPFDSP